jgi:hypothetical protein
MKFDPRIHHRRSIRLKGYDYTLPGAYYITIDIEGHEWFLGEVQDARMLLSRCGKIVQQAWLDLPHHYPHIRLDAFCLMPDHIHGIIVLVADMIVRPSGFPSSNIDVGAGLPSLPQTLHLKLTDLPNQPTPNEDPPLPIESNAPETTRHSLPEIVRAFKSLIHQIRANQNQDILVF